MKPVYVKKVLLFIVGLTLVGFVTTYINNQQFSQKWANLQTRLKEAKLYANKVLKQENDENTGLNIEKFYGNLEENEQDVNLKLEKENEKSSIQKQKDNDVLVAKRFQERFDTLRKYCPPHKTTAADWLNLQRGQSFSFVPRNIFICQTPKTGTSTWKEHWRRAYNLYNITVGKYSGNFANYLRDVTTDWVKKKGKKIFKTCESDHIDFLKPTKESCYGVFRALTVRHPFGRLISAWSNKFHKDCIRSTPLIRGFREEVAKFKTKPSGNYSIAWGDFAEFMVKMWGKIEFDRHVVPIDNTCHTCSVHYQYVIKLESVSQDASWLFRRWGLDKLELVHKNESPGGSKVISDPGQTIGRMIGKLRPDVAKKLYKIYENDFKYFGYTYNFKTNSAGGWQ